MRKLFANVFWVFAMINIAIASYIELDETTKNIRYFVWKYYGE